MQRLTPGSRRERATSEATPVRIGSAALMLALMPALVLGVATIARAELPSATAADIRQALASGRPTVIDLGARSCIPCKRLAPILESLADTYRGKARGIADVSAWARRLGGALIAIAGGYLLWNV